MKNTKQLTVGQVKLIAKDVAKRWKFVNRGSYYNCIDTQTGQQSILGGKYNFASYYFHNRVERMYVEMVGEDLRYTNSCSNSEKIERQSYLFKIQREVIKILCGFEG